MSWFSKSNEEELLEQELEFKKELNRWMQKHTDLQDEYIAFLKEHKKLLEEKLTKEPERE